MATGEEGGETADKRRSHGAEFPVAGARHPAPHCGCGPAEADVETVSAPTRNSLEDKDLIFEWQAISRGGVRAVFTKSQR
jgi:hypothetical protein